MNDTDEPQNRPDILITPAMDDRIFGGVTALMLGALQVEDPELRKILLTGIKEITQVMLEANEARRDRA